MHGQQAGAVQKAATGVRSAVHSFFMKANQEEKQEPIFLGMQAAV